VGADDALVLEFAALLDPVLLESLPPTVLVGALAERRDAPVEQDERKALPHRSWPGAFGTSGFAYGSAAWGFVRHCSPAADPSQGEPRIGLHRSKRSREQRHTHQERFHRESHGFIPWGLPA
jgi:hypothetical protein